MTGMLASVASFEEAKIALKHKVDIIDLKNPRLGVLGQLDKEIISSVVELVNNRLPVSATIGDVEPNDPKLSSRIIKTANLLQKKIHPDLNPNSNTERLSQIVNEAKETVLKDFS